MSNRRHLCFPATAGLALSLALGSLAAVGGVGCQSDEEVFDPGDGTLQGELAIYAADDFEQGVQTMKYAIRSASGEERWLDLDRDPGIEPGARIKVWGTRFGERMQVSSIAKLAAAIPTQKITSALKNGTKFPAKRLAFVIIDIGMGSNITPENALREIVGPSTNTDPPLRNYYAEASYGTEELDGQVFGPFSYNIGSCNTSGMPTMFRAMVDQMGGGTFNNYLWYIGSRTSACSWSGLGQVGRPDRPARDTWYNGSSSCVVMIQEPGHNFGMQHSSSMDCGSVAFHDTPDGNCTHSEYGDRYDPMGGGCRHMNAWQKTYNGWLQGCNMVRVRSSGTYTLVPLELGCDGAQVLQIPAPKTRPFPRSGGGGSATVDMLTHYYLELRTKTGIDTSLTSTNPVAAPSVHVRISGDIRGRADRGLHTWILDMDPASANFDGLGVGKTFEDPAGGLSFTITELDATHATVNVTMTANGGGPVCMDGTTAFTPPGPGIESCNPGISTPGGGIGGAGGTTATGGTMGGGAGRGGTTGTGMAGRGGTTGVAGTTGASGRGGTTGAAGTIPIGGSNGAAGTNGPAGTNGAAGTGEAGTDGQGGTTGSAGTTGIKPNPVTGGCACDVGGGGPSPMLVLALAFGLRVARRYRRSSEHHST